MPKTTVFVLNSPTRAIILSVLLVIFAIIQIKKKDEKVHIDAIDFCWVILILYTALGAFGATNKYFVAYGTFSTLLLFISYKAFQTIDWDRAGVRKLYYYTTLSCLCIAIFICLYAVRDVLLSGFVSKKVDKAFVALFDKNMHFLGSLIVILFPYILFTDVKHKKVIPILLLAISAVAVYITGSAQVTILLGLTGLLYVLFLTRGKKMYRNIIIAGFLSVAAITLYNGPSTNNKSFIVREFSQQNDRLLMWKNSINLFMESPLVGKGKNSWAIESGKFGYNDYQHFKKDIASGMRYIHPHNSFFSILSEQGILGVIIYLLLGLFPLLQLIKKRHSLSKLEIAAFVSILLFLFLSFIYGSVYNTYGKFKGITILTVFSLAIIGKRNQSSKTIIQLNARIFYVLLLIGSLLCSAYFNELNSNKKKLSQAKLEMKSGNISQALSTLERANRYVKDSRSIIDESNNLVWMGNTNEAIKIMEDHLYLDPHNLAFLYKLSALHFRNQNYQAALNVSNTALSLDKYYYNPKLVHAKANYMLNRNIEAVDELKMLLKDLDSQSKLNYKYSRRNNQFFPKYEWRYKVCENYKTDLISFMKNNNISTD